MSALRSRSFFRCLLAIGGMSVLTGLLGLHVDGVRAQTRPLAQGAPLVDPYAAVSAELALVDFTALRLAIQDLTDTFPGDYGRGAEYLGRATQYEARLPEVLKGVQRREAATLQEAREIVAFQRRALLSNPLIDFDRLLLIKRKPLDDARRATGDPGNDKGLGKFLGLPQQSSHQLHSIKDTTGWDNEIAVLSGVRGEGSLSTLYKPRNGGLVSNIDLEFDAEKILFSMPDDDLLWQLYEIELDDSSPRRLSPNDPGVHNFDGCYLPNGKVAFISTATFQGVPCNTELIVGMTYLMDGDGQNIRQICFDQDHNFSPTVMNDGRILYLRWEYTDIPHVWARFLFTMNPDGTRQREFYGGGSYWPNGIWYARPVPGHPTKVVGIVTGHHVGRVGELYIFDPALGRHETEGVVQQIPGRTKKIEPLIEDKLTLNTWPKFLHPYPLSEKYFLVSCKPSPGALWGIYLVDVFDNMALVKELEGYALLEPIPLRKTKRPPVIVEQMDLARDGALMYISDVYGGPGLAEVPRGAVKNLRLFTYHFGYQAVAGITHRVGADGPWEPKRVLGTVPVEEDGSAFFKIPANTPISIQPLDAQGNALQLMRSWTTAMPGEFVSCTGCHENQNTAPPNRATLAIKKAPVEIQPWYGAVRGFSFKREVQPVLDKYCVGCHDGNAERFGFSPKDPRDGAGPVFPDLRGDQGKLVAYRNGIPEAELVPTGNSEQLFDKYGGVFEPAYIELRRYVRVGGLESDLRLLDPGEFHADTSELFQMLHKGHHGVVLDKEAWDRLSTWIDLNAPAHGTWRETAGEAKTLSDAERRRRLSKRYANKDESPEAIPEMPSASVAFVPPKPMLIVQAKAPAVVGWPLTAAEAKHLQQSAGIMRRTVALGEGVTMELVRIPAGRFVMGDASGERDELPLAEVVMDEPFWMAAFEVTNEQYARFDPAHDSRYQDKGSWMFNEWDLGWDLSRAEQPVVRLSQERAIAFCRWLSQRTGLKVALPTEAQWEYACRAGTGTPLSYGDLDTDFSTFANMADATMRGLAYDARDQYPPDLVPRDGRFNDNMLVTADVGSYKPNAWGLYDMHGNVWEWTRSTYEPYPYREDDGRNDRVAGAAKVVRGGSWYDRPKRARSAFRLSYPSWRRVYNVGFRVVIGIEAAPQHIAPASVGKGE